MCTILIHTWREVRTCISLTMHLYELHSLTCYVRREGKLPTRGLFSKGGKGGDNRSVCRIHGPQVRFFICRGRWRGVCYTTREGGNYLAPSFSTRFDRSGVISQPRQMHNGGRGRVLHLLWPSRPRPRLARYGTATEQTNLNHLLKYDWSLISVMLHI